MLLAEFSLPAVTGFAQYPSLCVIYIWKDAHEANKQRLHSHCAQTICHLPLHLSAKCECVCAPTLK